MNETRLPPTDHLAGVWLQIRSLVIGSLQIRSLVKIMPLYDRLEHNPDVIAQSSGESLVLFHMSSGRYYSLNELGARIWELCDGSRSFSEIVALVAAEYDAPQGVIFEDSRTLVAALIEGDLLLAASAGQAIEG